MSTTYYDIPGIYMYFVLVKNGTVISVIDKIAFYCSSSLFQLNIKFIGNELLYEQNNSYYKQAHKETQIIYNT